MKDYFGPDLKSPRYRKNTIEIINRKFYSDFKKKYPEYKNISNSELRNKIEKMNGYIWNTVIDERDGVELPNGLGKIFIGSCPRPKKRTNVDFNTSNKLGVKVSHSNMNSDSRIMKIFYVNYEEKYKFKFWQLWGFKGVRQFTRTASSRFKEEYPKYYVPDPMVSISKIFRRNYYTFYGKEIQEQQYNEFKMD